MPCCLLMLLDEFVVNVTLFELLLAGGKHDVEDKGRLFVDGLYVRTLPIVLNVLMLR